MAVVKRWSKPKVKYENMREEYENKETIEETVEEIEEVIEETSNNEEVAVEKISKEEATAVIEDDVDSDVDGDIMVNTDKMKIYFIRISRNEEDEISLNLCIENKLDKFDGKATVEKRNLESRQVLVMRGKLTQDGHDYYVYVRKDVQSGLDIMQGTVWYFTACLTIITILGYLGMKKDGEEQQTRSRKADYRLMESQREFVANISHELKTPLAVVSSQVEMLEIGEDKINRPYYYASIREELDKMSKMVGELLDFSMLDNQMNAMEISKVNVSEMLEYLLLRYDAMFRKNEIKVNSDLAANCYVYGNRMYLERAVNNYLMNAFQHTQQGKQITVTLRREKQSLYLEVCNDGEPIREDQMERIWDSFYTSSKKKNPSAEVGKNIGLGLFVVRKIVEKHKGSCGLSFSIVFS